MPKKDFESALSHYIRLYCSQCKNWGKICNLSDKGLFAMYVCMMATMVDDRQC
uniref:Uncharacterized protein n=1 Tax=viral metagenome TaxID=1070528 RepID=A0A6M3Y0B5_9ZZZZ